MTEHRPFGDTSGTAQVLQQRGIGAELNLLHFFHIQLIVFGAGG
ncbi:hypothetical protein ACT691_17355 [Vibrio metschnikovii]